MYVRAPIAHEDRRAPRERPGAGERPLRPTPVAPIAKRVKNPSIPNRRPEPTLTPVRPFRRSPSSQPTVVIKVGTSSLLRTEAGTLPLPDMHPVRDRRAAHTRRGEGRPRLFRGGGGRDVPYGPHREAPEVAKKQALAAVGQVHLMRYYEDIFNTIGIKCAQVLLTLENLSNRKQYVRARTPSTRSSTWAWCRW